MLITKVQLKFCSLNESYYYEDTDSVCWHIFDDNMYYVNDLHEYTLHLLKGVSEAENIAVVMRQN